MNFKHFIMEDAAQQGAIEMQQKIKEIAAPQNIQNLLSSIGGQNPEEIIAKIKNHPNFTKLVALYQNLKARQSANEAYLNEGIWSFIGSIFNGLFGIVKWAIGSITKTISHVLAPVIRGSGLPRLNYVAMALLTFGLAPYLLSIGATAAATSPFVLGFTASWWGLMWFGKNFLEPFLKATGA